MKTIAAIAVSAILVIFTILVIANNGDWNPFDGSGTKTYTNSGKFPCWDYGYNRSGWTNDEAACRRFFEAYIQGNWPPKVSAPGATPTAQLPTQNVPDKVIACVFGNNPGDVLYIEAGQSCIDTSKIVNAPQTPKATATTQPSVMPTPKPQPTDTPRPQNTATPKIEVTNCTAAGHDYGGVSITTLTVADGHFLVVDVWSEGQPQDSVVLGSGRWTAHDGTRVGNSWDYGNCDESVVNAQAAQHALDAKKAGGNVSGNVVDASTYFTHS